VGYKGWGPSNDLPETCTYTALLDYTEPDAHHLGFRRGLERKGDAVVMGCLTIQLTRDVACLEIGTLGAFAPGSGGYWD